MATAAPATAAATANKAELLAIADAVAREKLIDKAIVIEAMEDAIQRAARARYGAENDIRAKLDGETGDLRLWRVLEVVESETLENAVNRAARDSQPGETVLLSPAAASFDQFRDFEARGDHFRELVEGL